MRLLTLCLCLVVGPVNAALTDAEKTSVKAGIEATFRIGSAEKYLAQAIAIGTTSPEARSALADAMEAIIYASLDLSHGTTILMGGTARVAGIPEFEALPRERQMAEGRFYLNRAAGALVQVQAAMTRATVFNPEDQTYQDSLRRARDIWLALAISRLAAVDRSLLYADPPPEPPCAGCATRPTVGPHGDYYAFQHALWRATHYWRSWALDAAALYRAGVDQMAVAGAFAVYTDGIDYQHHAEALIAGVGLDASDDAKDQFCKVLEALSLLTSLTERRTAWTYHVLTTSWAPVRSTLPLYSDSWVHLSDSWRHSDHAAWMLMVFKNEPQVSRCRS